MCVYVCVYACALVKKKWVEARVWKILNAVWTLYCKQQGPTGNVICGHKTLKLSCRCEDLDFSTLRVLGAK